MSVFHFRGFDQNSRPEYIDPALQKPLESNLRHGNQGKTKATVMGGSIWTGFALEHRKRPGDLSDEDQTQHGPHTQRSYRSGGQRTNSIVELVVDEDRTQYGSHRDRIRTERSCGW